MSSIEQVKRYLVAETPSHLRLPKIILQPILAKKGTPNIDLQKLAKLIEPDAQIEPLIAIDSPSHWEAIVSGLSPKIDAILPMSVPAYPTEVWNSHPYCLMKRKLPVVFWPIVDYDEPDFWRWSARDYLRALGVEVYLPENNADAVTVIKSLAMRRFLQQSKLVVFGIQNFPWNAESAGGIITEHLGTQILVRQLSEIRSLYPAFTKDEIKALWTERKGRYIEKSVKESELHQAIKTYLAIKKILEREHAAGFGVNCFGDLIINGGRDVPCLAQSLLREDGYIASCDGDFLAMMSMMFTTYFLDKTSMMSNLYPIKYVGALTDHFGNPLSPDEQIYDRRRWKNLARMAHCGFVGVISPEMTPRGKTTLCDWGGTYEIKRSGLGCGLDGDLEPAEVTVVELCFNGRKLLLAKARICEITRHKDMPHCESSALLEFDDLEGFVRNISREHAVIVYGNHIAELTRLSGVLNLEVQTF